MKRTIIALIASLFLLASCDESLPAGYGTQAEDSGITAGVSVSLAMPVQITPDVATTPINTYSLPGFEFEAAEEDFTYTLTNISDEKIVITDVNMFVNYAESVGIKIRQIEVEFGDLGRSLTIDYVDGAPDIEDPGWWFNPLMDDIPEPEVPLAAGESCTIILYTPYPLPEVTDYFNNAKPRAVKYTFDEEELLNTVNSSAFPEWINDYTDFHGSLNAEMTELMYQDGDDIYIVRNGTEIICAAENVKYYSDVFHLFPEYTAVLTDYENIDFDIKGVDSFAGTYYLSSDDGIDMDTTIAYIGDDFRLHDIINNTIVPGTDYYADNYISKDGKVISFRCENVIYRFDCEQNSLTSIADKALSFFATHDGNRFYYFAEDTGLYFVDTNGESKLIGSGFSNYQNNQCFVLDGNNFVFLAENLAWFADGETVTELKPHDEVEKYLRAKFDGSQIMISGVDKSYDNNYVFYVSMDGEVTVE